MPLIKREFFVPCRGDECFKLAEMINEKTPQVELLDIDINNNGLRIRMYGYKSDIRRAWNTIKQIVKTYRMPMGEGRGRIRKISISYIVEKIKHTFPPTILVYILRKMGYQAEFLSDTYEILTDADPEYVVELADRIAGIVEEIKDLVRGTATKYFIIAASILLDTDPRDVIKGSIQMGILGEEEGKYIIRVEWRQALEEVIKEEKHSIKS